MTRHRIALVGSLPPYRGGIAHFTTQTWQVLAARGHEVHGVSFSRQYPGLLFPGSTQYEPQPVPTPGPVQRWIDSVGPASWVRSGRRLRALAPDAVVFNYWMPFFGPAYGTVLRQSRAPGIGIIHNAIPHERRPFDRALGRWFLSACRGFVVLSEEVEHDLRALGHEAPIVRVPHPIYDRFGPAPTREDARRQLGLDPERPLLLFFGYVRAYKGLDDLIDALARVHRTRPEVQLLVAGEFYEDEERTRSRIRDLGLEASVHLRAGYLPDDAVAPCFAAADAVVQPYRSATQSGVAQIAYHFGRAMILTDVGGLAEIVPHEIAGLVVPPANVPALAAAIERFYAEELESHLAENVRNRRKLFSWDRLAEAIETLVPAHH